MIATLMIYCFSVAALISVAAFAIESAIGVLGWQRRAVWIAAILASLCIPPLMIVIGAIEPQQSLTVANIQTIAVSAAIVNPPIAGVLDPLVSLLAVLAKLAWMASSIGLLSFMLVGWIRLRLAARCWKTAMIDGVSVRVTDNVGPAVIGFIKPEIVVPRWLLSAPAAERGAALAHERSHITAGDPFLLFIALLMVGVMPWNLPLWWQLRRLRFAIEVDCDHRVLSSGTSIATYGEMLLSIGQRNSHTPVGAMAMTKPASQLERRIRIMTKGTFRFARLFVLVSIATSTTVVAVATQLDAPALNAIAPSLFAPRLMDETSTSPEAMTPTPSVTGDVNETLVSSKTPTAIPTPPSHAEIPVRKRVLPQRIAQVEQSKPSPTTPSSNANAATSKPADATGAAAEKRNSEGLNLNFENVEVRSVLKTLADIGGQYILVSDNVTGKISIRLIDVPWSDAVARVCATAGLTIRKDGQILHVEPISVASTPPPDSGAAPDRNVKRTRYVAPVKPEGIPQSNSVRWVEVAFTVTADGTVGNAEVYRSQPDTVCNDAALTAVRQWAFEPAVKDGQPVDTRTIVRIRF